MNPWYRLGDDSYGDAPSVGALLRHIFVLDSKQKLKHGFELPYAELMVYDDGVTTYRITDEESEFISEDIFIGVHSVAELKRPMDFTKHALLEYIKTKGYNNDEKRIQKRGN